MLKNFASWFIVFGLSFLVSNVFGWTDQGKAFLYIYFGIDVVIIIGLLLFLVIVGHATGDEAETNGISLVLVLVTAAVFAITLFATWGATKLFGVDFYVAYQIMTFGQCLYPRNEKKED